MGALGHCRKIAFFLVRSTTNCTISMWPGRARISTWLGISPKETARDRVSQTTISATILTYLRLWKSGNKTMSMRSRMSTKTMWESNRRRERDKARNINQRNQGSLSMKLNTKRKPCCLRLFLFLFLFLLRSHSNSQLSCLYPLPHLHQLWHLH